MFQLQPILTGELITLRPLQSEDFDRLYDVASDPLIWEQHPARDRYQESVFRKFFDEGIASGGAFLINDNSSGQIIGSSRYCAYSEHLSEIEIGYTFLGRDYWGGRYNAELKYLMLRHAFQFIDSVMFVVGDRNFRSQQAVLKLGALADPSEKQKHSDRIIFRLRKEDYAKHPHRYVK
ncbi:GNAT family N-acetyltransferase [Undibacterium sp. LX40W]|uniref:GNAT family N-acetyltransferase n=1 Tax=Undibacterium nitidum TaxID=2762298 RepID=A0A923HQZ1_9BURK|nr:MULTISPECIES: GNAT family N-acetyltransferase [Undibacterium]MBC3882456.1 GNAT family N-acetyltransferase [Undibacterium nitidum]MBC3892737.1 GNAT family N-acetyltransferase [Undibacterium sp. LX40W]